MKPLYQSSRKFYSQHKIAIALVLIIALAVFFRFWRLDSLPPGLHPDEAANGLDVFRIQAGDIRPLYNTNGPRESLFFFLQAIFVALFGNTILALRLAPAFIGVFAVVATYLMTRAWFSQRTALVSAFLMASAPWAVTLTRDGFRASMVPLMIPLSAWLFTNALKKRRWWAWSTLAGLSFGAGFYTYLSYRMAPFIVAALIVFAISKYRSRFLEYLKPLILSSAVAAIVVLPLGIYGLQHPEDIAGRSSVSFTNPELNGGKPLKTLGQTIGKTALMFNFQGDSNYRHNFGSRPMLNAFSGLMFVMGVLLALRRIFDIRYFALLAIFGAMLVPEILTAEGIPHALRAIGVIPVIYIFAAIAISELVSRWRGVFPRNKAALGSALVLLVGLLVLSTYYNYQRYFVAWANDPQTYEAYGEDNVAVANYLIKSPYSGPRYVVTGGYGNITIEYLTHNKTTYQAISPDDLIRLKSQSTIQVVVVDYLQIDTDQVLLNLKAEAKHKGVSEYRRDKVLYKVYEIKPTQ